MCRNDVRNGISYVCAYTLIRNLMEYAGVIPFSVCIIIPFTLSGQLWLYCDSRWKLENCGYLRKVNKSFIFSPHYAIALYVL